MRPKQNCLRRCLKKKAYNGSVFKRALRRGAIPPGSGAWFLGIVMTNFRFYQPIEIRYGDIDAQRHVNNAKYFTFLESARAMYLQHLGLWDGRNFDDIGIILVETNCTFKAPISFGQRIRVGVRTIRIGTKSIELVHTFQDADSGEEMAAARSVIVAYDYRKGISIAVPQAWREAVETFEGSE